MSQFGLIPDTDEGLDGSSGRRERVKSKPSGWLAVIVSLAVVLGAGAVVFTVGQTLLSEVSDTLDFGPQDYSGPGSGSAIVTVNEGDTASDIAVTLVENEVVASEEAFVDAAAKDEASFGIQPGSYEMPQQIPATEALAVLVDPANRIVGKVLVREGLRVEQVLNAYVEQAGMGRKALRTAAQSPKEIGLPPEAKGDPEGFLFPATYEVEPTTSEAEALKAMTTKYKQVAADLSMKAKAKKLGYTKREIMTIASIVQAEAGTSEDMAKVARVIYNRLDDGEALYMDSTVAFANDTYTVFTTDEQRAIDSPYNTYLYAGLPPGPINSPGADAIEAALNPAKGTWKYFVTVNLETGETKFADTLSEHNENVADAQANNYGQ